MKIEPFLVDQLVRAYRGEPAPLQLRLEEGFAERNYWKDPRVRSIAINDDRDVMTNRILFEVCEGRQFGTERKIGARGPVFLYN